MKQNTKVLIFINALSKEVVKASDEMKAYFDSINVDYKIVKLFDGYDSDGEIDLKSDLIVTLGGDGTVLRAANLIGKTRIPILAVNMGTFGYITESTFADYKEVFDCFLTGKATIEERMRLKVVVKDDNGKIVREESALNDITLGSSSHSKTAKVTLKINGILASNLKGDGLIISTPTGSTAYNLSAGGPILDVELSNIIINPLCPFTMGFRPLVIDANKNKITLSIPKQVSDLILTVDGNDLCKIDTKHEVEIVKDLEKTFFVKNNKRNYIEIIRDKLGWAGGFNA